MQYLSVLFVSIVLLAGCATQQQTRLATTGAAVGAAAGAAIGSQSNRTSEGAIIGGVLGAAAGMILAEPTTTTGQYKKRTYRRVNQHDRENDGDREYEDDE